MVGVEWNIPFALLQLGFGLLPYTCGRLATEEFGRPKNSSITPAVPGTYERMWRIRALSRFLLT